MRKICSMRSAVRSLILCGAAVVLTTTSTRGQDKLADVHRPVARAADADLSRKDHVASERISAGIPRPRLDRAVPSNDDCENATQIGPLPATVPGDTTEATDDTPTTGGNCGVGITAPGVWYAVVGTGNTITASLCGGASFDTRMSVFCGDCTLGLVCIDGDDDTCGLQSELAWCTEAGTTYYILVNGFNGDTGVFELTVTDDETPCNTAPDCGVEPITNDTCDTAIDVGSLPADLEGTTVGALNNDEPPASTCDTAITAPGVWYTVEGTGATITASLCNPGTDYDTKMNIYCGDCSAGLLCVAGNDDGDLPCDRESEVTWCSETGVTYFILVQGFNGATGGFQLTVDDDATPCASPPSCEACQFACDPGSIAEGEPTCQDDYIDIFNSGCNAQTPAFSAIDCETTICGATGTFTDSIQGDTRDTDWYRLALSENQVVTLTFEAQFPGIVGFIDNMGLDNCPPSANFLTSTITAACERTSIAASLPAGTWYLFASTADFTGVPCGSEYELAVSCAAPTPEACCFSDGACAEILPDDCIATGGVHQGLLAACATASCPTIPPNDICANATPVGVPSTTIGTTFDATIDDNAPDCPAAAVTSPGVWYSVTGTGSSITASICDGSFSVDEEAKISVYCGSCTDLFCAAAITNYDSRGCQAIPTRATWCSEPGVEYLILVHGFSGNEFDFELLVTHDGEPCSKPPLCQACVFACDPGSTPESEPACSNGYTDTFNAGCDASPQVFSDIDCSSPVTICGTSGNYTAVGGLEARDTDWYRLVLPEARRVTLTMTAGFPATFGIPDNGGIDSCAAVESFLASAVTSPCVPQTLVADLSAGAWYLYASTAGFTGTPCGSEYELTVECDITGACCLPNPAARAPCVALTEQECEDTEGFYLGDGAQCSTVFYRPDSGDAPFEDISSTGIPTGLTDETELAVLIGFNFSLYGTVYDTIHITDNGYATFLPVTGASFINQAIPDINNPNSLVAPLWDDFDPGAAGEVYYQTLGTTPFRRLVIQWDNVPQYLDTDANTFQLVLEEGTSCIEFRYQSITPEAFTGDYTVGIENQDGTDALSIPGATITDGQLIRMCLTLTADPCPRCIGDADHNGRTDAFDFSLLAGYFGEPVVTNTSGDLNGDAIVNIWDFTLLAADYSCGTEPPAAPAD